MLLDSCAPGEQNKYAGIGATVFFTALMAFIASGYALYTVFDSIPMAIGFGFECGCALPYRLRPVGCTKRVVHAGRKEVTDESAAAHAITWLISMIDQRHIH